MNELDIGVADLDVGRLRAALALRGLRHTEFARQANISRCYLSVVLHGHRQPGELTRRRIASGLCRVGIGLEEVRHAA